MKRDTQGHDMDENAKITLDEIMAASQKEVESWHKLYGNSGLVSMLKSLNFNRKFVKASGARVWDDKGREYLDFLGGYGSLNVGHNHPRIAAAISKVLKDTPKILQTTLSNLDGGLKAKLAAITPGDLTTSFLANSGAEAIEGAVKLARSATHRTKILATQKGFHGKTMGALSVTGKGAYQKPFAPLLPDCEFIPFNDIKALEEALAPREIAAFVIEPVQGEAGIILPDKGYLRSAVELCRHFGTLLIADEIQTGLGRTGRLFACLWDEATPDIMTMAKSLSGGMVPIGAFITRRDIWNSAYGGMKKALLHTSTFGGNALACAAAIETINIIFDEKLTENAAVVGDYLMDKLNDLAKTTKVIAAVRGIGLMIGVEMNKPHSAFVTRRSEGYSATLASLIAGDLLNNQRIITAFTLNNPHTIRLEPPLLIKKTDADILVDALEESCTKNKSYARAIFSTAKNLIT